MPDGWEWAILVLIALLLFGGSRLSGVGRDVGRRPSQGQEEPKVFEVAAAAGGQLPTPIPGDSDAANANPSSPDGVADRTVSSPAEPKRD
jgi:hypothetical protein